MLFAIISAAVLLIKERIRSRSTQILGRQRSAPRKRIVNSLRARRLVHLLAQTKWSHVCPNISNVVQTLLLLPLLTYIPPTLSVFSVRGPNRVLFLLIDNHLVDDLIFLALVHGEDDYRNRLDQVNVSAYSQAINRSPVEPKFVLAASPDTFRTALPEREL
jgi:hypothetical protein